MIVAFLDARIDAPHVDLRSYRRIFRMFAIDFDPAAEARELAASRPKELMHTKPDRRARWIELVALAPLMRRNLRRSPITAAAKTFCNLIDCFEAPTALCHSPEAGVTPQDSIVHTFKR